MSENQIPNSQVFKLILSKWMQKFALLFAVLYSLTEVYSFKLGLESKISFVLIGFFSMLAFLSKSHLKVTWVCVVIYVFYMLTLFLFSVDNNVSYLVSDFFLSVLVFFVALAFKDLDFMYERYFQFFCVLYIAVFLLVWFFGINRVNGRFPAFSPFLLFLFVLPRENQVSMLIKLALYFLLMLGIYQSGERTALILGVLIGACYLFVHHRHCFFSIMLVCGVVLFLSLFVFNDILIKVLLGTRFDVFFQGEVDHSLKQRFLEFRDVFHMLVKDLSSGEFYQVFFGNGLGATFEPIVSFSKNNILDDGSVHHLHSTPVVLLFRYGLVGVTAYFVFFVFLVYQLLISYVIDEKYFIICVFLMLAVLDGLFRNSLVNPWFFICLGAFFSYRKPVFV